MAAAGIALGLSLVVAQAAPTPTPSVPSAPKSLKATVGDTQVSLSWSPPATGTGINGYQVRTSPADIPPAFIQAISFQATGLTNGRTYTFTVRAHNPSGYGPAGFITATPHVFPPGPPTDLAATPGPSDGQYTLSWNPPTSTGSSPDGTPPTIAHYNVKISPSATCAPIDQFSCIASNIPANATSTFSVTATNSRNITGPAATVQAPLPTGATIGLAPTAGLANANIVVTGQLFLDNENITLYWDTPTHVAASVVTDANGAFTKTVKPFAGDKPKVHKLCASVPPKPCANFSLQPPPTPTAAVTPTPGESPTPSGSPQASGPRTGGGNNGGLSGLDIITRPPFVFLPILGIIGLLGVLAFWAFTGRRRSPAPAGAATVTHRATRPDYMTPFPTRGAPPVAPSGGLPPGVQPPPAMTPPHPVQPAWQAPAAPYAQPPVQPTPPPAAAPPVPPPPAATPPAPPPPAATPPPGPVEWPAPPSWAGPDEPPDLPQPSD
jgi:hypothetical protein